MVINGNIYVQAKQHSMCRKWNKDLMDTASEQRRKEHSMKEDNLADTELLGIPHYQVSLKVSIAGSMESESSKLKGFHSLLQELVLYPKRNEKQLKVIKQKMM